MSTLVCEGMGYRAGGRELVHPLDLRLDDIGITVVLGSNGAGKTLLLKLLHGLLKPSTGHVRWDNGRPAQTMVLQKPVMLRRSVADNLRIVPAAGGDAGRVHACLEWAELTQFAALRADLLSPGIQQQVALARARLCNPQWLFLDEPSASLDPAATERVEALIRMLAEDGVRVVLSSHDLAQSRRLATDIVFLSEGVAQYHAEAEQFFKAPASEAGESFLMQARF